MLRGRVILSSNETVVLISVTRQFQNGHEHRPLNYTYEKDTRQKKVDGTKVDGTNETKDDLASYC